MLLWLMLLGGLVLLVIGGELLVRGSVRVAEALGVSPLVIGLTLVGFGTSAPEMVTSIEASLAGSPGIAIGNVVGSNIANVLLILGCAALLTPITVASSALKRDGMVLLGVTALFVVVSFAVPFGRPVGALFLAMLAAYLWYAWRQERVAMIEGHAAAVAKAEAYEELREGTLADVPPKVATATIAISIALALGGLAIIIAGGKVLVDAAIGIAQTYQIPEAVIGLTIVAIGTSMPEFVTSFVAALRGHASIALGNVIGSNLFNTLGIGGMTALLAPTTVPRQIVVFDNIVMLGAVLALMLFAKSQFRIQRWEGGALLAGYVAYLALLWPK